MNLFFALCSVINYFWAYEYVGCGSIDIDFECGENDLEALHVECKAILTAALPVDDRARHCYKECTEIGGGYNYIIVHGKTNCICKKATPRVIDTTTDENDCGFLESLTRLNVVYRMSVGNEFNFLAYSFFSFTGNVFIPAFGKH